MPNLPSAPLQTPIPNRIVVTQSGQPASWWRLLTLPSRRFHRLQSITALPTCQGYFRGIGAKGLGYSIQIACDIAGVGFGSQLLTALLGTRGQFGLTSRRPGSPKRVKVSMTSRCPCVSRGRERFASMMARPTVGTSPDSRALTSARSRGP